MNIPTLKLGELTASIPIIQGGMGIGVSRAKLASAVANQGGIGIISGVQIGFQEEDFVTNTLEANKRALTREIRLARELSPKGIIGVNLLVAMNNYKEIAKTAVEENIDLIISGAGLPTDLPDIVKGSNTKIAPIVSSGKAASVMCKLWDKRYAYIPDLIIVEGPEAGGHLGFSLEQLQSSNKITLSEIVVNVIEAVKPFEEKYNKKIPVIAAGGIYTGEDIARYLKLGAAGVQMATRFIATEECDADIRYKQAFINAKETDLQLVVSPVGMPGRAITNEFTKKLEVSKVPITRCYNCLKPCNPKDTAYCISDALMNAVKGDLDKGLIFTGSNAYRINEIVKVKDLIDELVSEIKLS